MKKLIVFSFILLATVALLSDCRSDKYIPNICFNSDILPIFVSNCSMKECHGNGSHKGGYKLDTYDGIMKGITPYHPLLSEIYNQIRGSNPSMPPQDHNKLSAKDLDKIKSWIAFGATNSSNCSAACDSSVFTFSGGVMPILNTWCTGCHNSSNASAGYDLSNYQGVANATVNNKLMGAINQQAGYIAMPQGTGKLSDCDIRIIQKWIDSGKPNN